VLPVFLFVAFWAVLGLSVFFIAIRGGPRGARETVQRQSLTSRRVAAAVFVVVYIGFGVLIPAGFLRGNRDNASAQVGGLRLTSNEKQGRELFSAHCGVCHTLAAANAVGKVGPNLDQLRPPESLVLHTINNGCLQKPLTSNSPQNCLGQGTMPAGILQGRQAVQVSQFVARVAGKE
jgi:mono/diheme cytochrome c family protein